MNRYHLLSYLFFITSGILFVYGFLLGEFSGGFILIFPFLQGTGAYSTGAVLLLILGFLMLTIGSIAEISQNQDYYIDEQGKTIEIKSKIKGGGVILIGPIPIVFGSNKKIALSLLMISLIIIIIMLILSNI